MLVSSIHGKKETQEEDGCDPKKLLAEKVSSAPIMVKALVTNIYPESQDTEIWLLDVYKGVDLLNKSLKLKIGSKDLLVRDM